MYTIVNDSHLDGLKTRFSKISNSEQYKVTKALGKHHDTSSFSISDDEHFDITYHNESTFDRYTIGINVLAVDFSITLNQANKCYNPRDDENSRFGIQEPLLTITVGDLFKHYYKQNMLSSESKGSKKTKKSKKGGDEDDNDKQQINKLTIKALKVTNEITDVKCILGSLDTWAGGLQIWDDLVRDGHLSAGGNDFVSFCRMQVVLPTHERLHSVDALIAKLATLASFDLVKQLVRHHLYAEVVDESKTEIDKIQEFDEPKSLAEILELYHDQLSSHKQFKSIHHKLTKSLNNEQEQLLDDEYTPVTFKFIHEVDVKYPVYALRNVYLENWAPPEGSNKYNDFFVLMSLVKNVGRAENRVHREMKREKFNKFQELQSSDYD